MATRKRRGCLYYTSRTPFDISPPGELVRDLRDEKEGGEAVGRDVFVAVCSCRRSRRCHMGEREERALEAECV